MELLLIFGVGLIVVLCGTTLVWYAQRSPKHKHRGRETGRRYVPGVLDLGGSVKGFVDDKIVYGYTEITYRCECGHYWNERVVGRINE